MKFDVLHNFISPVTGRVLADPEYILVGDRQGVATPSPALIDLRLKIIDLKHDFDVLTEASFVIGFPNNELPNAQVLSTLANGFVYNTNGIISTFGSIPPSSLDLPYGQVFVGDITNHASASQIIGIDNLPNLPEGNIWIGDNTDRPAPNPIISIDNLPDLSAVPIPGLDYLAGRIWRGTPSNRPEESDALSFAEADILIINSRFYTTHFVLNSPNIIPTPFAQILSTDPLTAAGGIAKIIPITGKFEIAVPDVDYVTLSLLEEGIASIEEEIAALENEIEAEIAAIEAEIAGIQAEIVTIEGEIATLQTEIGVAAAAIALLQTQVAGLLITVAGHTSDIANLNTRIDDLRLNDISADGDVSFYGYKGINFADPTNSQDAATKHYVDDRPYGSIYMSGNATTTTLAANTYTKIDGTTTTASLNQFTAPVDNRIQYTGTPIINTLVTANVAISHNVALGTTIGISIYKNGAQVLAPTDQYEPTTGNLTSLTVSVYVQFTTNDYVEVYVQTTNASTSTVVNMNLSVARL